MDDIGRVQEWIEEGLLHPPESPNTVDLIRGLSSLCGVTDTVQSPASEQMAELIGQHDHYLFVIIDGLGSNHDGILRTSGFFKDTPRHEISAVFPSTTAAALTTIATGAWPGQHGFVGWFTHLPEHGKTILPLPFTERETDTPLSEYGISIAELVGAQSIIPKYDRVCKSYLRKDICNSVYSEWARGYTSAGAFGSPNKILQRLAFSASPHKKPSFTYLYISDVDSLSHKKGHNADAIKRMIAGLGEDLAFLKNRASGNVKIIVTADHGLIEIPEEKLTVITHEHPLMDKLEVPPSGEQRLPYFHVKKGKEKRFAGEFTDEFGEQFALITPEEGAELGLYGPDGLSEIAAKRLGTYIGITPFASAIEYVYPDMDPLGFKGMHGGLSADEMKVPLFITP